MAQLSNSVIFFFFFAILYKLMVITQNSSWDLVCGK